MVCIDRCVLIGEDMEQKKKMNLKKGFHLPQFKHYGKRRYNLREYHTHCTIDID